VIFVDLTFVPLITASCIAPAQVVEHVIVMTDAARRCRPTGATAERASNCYEDLIGSTRADCDLGRVRREHRGRALLHLGHHGRPQGRALFAPLQRAAHRWPARRTCWACPRATSVMPVVPMFHANAWSLAFSAPPGPSWSCRAPSSTAPRSTSCWKRGRHLHGRRADRLARLLQHLSETRGKPLTTLKRVVIGGSACPRAMTEAFEREYGVEVLHAWGMTEMSPLGTFCSVKPDYARPSCDERSAISR
jgi:hypothetical protein